MMGEAVATTPRFDEKDAAWHAERRTGLGGSDVAALLGLDPYKSAFAVFLEKTGQVPPADLSENEAVEWGNILEDPVGRKFAREMNVKIARVNRLLRHPYLPWAIAHIDFKIVGVKEGLEVKTAGYWASRSDEWGESGSDVIPANYMCQVQWYMGVTNWKRWHVAALIAGSTFRRYVIERDPDFIAELFVRGAAMWACVETNTPPTGSLTADEALAKFPTSVPKPIEATEEIARAVLRYIESKAAEKEALADREGVYAQIADYMGECDTLTFRGVPIMTWKSKSTGKRLDSKAHAAEQPECHARYTRDGSTRVMLPKEKFTL